MKRKPAISLDEYEYHDEGFWLYNFLNKLSIIIIPEFAALIPTLRHKKRGSPDFLGFQTYAPMLGFAGADSQKVMVQYQQMGRWYWRLYYVFSFMIYLVGGIFVILFANSLIQEVLSSLNQGNYSLFSNLYTFVSLALFGLLGWLYIFFILNWASRATLTFADQYFAEMLCVAQLFHIVILLERDNVLKIPAQKRELLTRINFLANKVILLGYGFIKSPSYSKEWCQQHFKHIETYLRERERWVVAPRENTLERLRHDFYTLTEMFVSGQYGDFEWSAAAEEAAEVPSRSLAERVTGAALRFLGLATPVAILALMILFPQPFSQLGMDRQIVSIVAVAWLLLAIDAVLKLGVVERITDLARALRELR
jgi:hypothetical protein